MNLPLPDPVHPTAGGWIVGLPSAWQRSRLIRRASVGVCCCLLLAGIVLLGDDYGQSWDDHGDARFGAASMKAYIGDPGFLQGHGDRLFYGPIYFMLSHVAVRLGRTIVPGVLAVDIRHGLNAVTVVLAGAAVYWLAVRLTRSPSAAIVTVLLFCLQPVVFGHAFINQKDAPFMASFVLAVATGILAVDASRRPKTPASSRAGTDKPVSVPSVRTPSARSMLARGGLVLAVVALLVDLLRWGLAYQALSHLLGIAYAQTGPDWLNALFQAVAQDAHKTPFPLYLQKLSLAYAWTSIVAGLGLLAVLALILLRWLPPDRGRPFRRGLRNGLTFAAAGGVLGLCLSIRPVGMFAGGLVVLYALLRPGRRMVAGLGAYLLGGVATAYLAWPFLWGTPLANLLSSLQLMLDFYPHLVLFDRTHYASTDLPRIYLPSLLAIQLTETALLAIGAGTVLAVQRLGRRHPSLDLLAVILAWLVVPLAYVLVFRPSIYGNFRQFLFVLPPLFLIAGLAVVWLFARLRRPALQALAAAIMLAPGLTAIVRLHPYQYIYYNSLIGGPPGAVDRFPLDYWCTSYREAMDYVNDHAQAGALISVQDPMQVARTFARADLIVEAAPTADPPDFALVCDEQHMMDKFYREMTPVFVVTVDGAILAEVKQRPPASGSEASSP